jgi:hypothetical protein
MLYMYSDSEKGAISGLIHGLGRDAAG